MATKRAAKKATKTSNGSVKFRSTSSGSFSVRFPKPAPSWQSNLENNLVEEGVARSKARQLVKMAAS